MVSNKIPVVLASDNNQVHAMATVISSALLSANSDTAYDFFCLIAEDVSAENRERLLRCQNIKSGTSITLVNMKPWLEPLRLEYHKTSGIGYSISTATLFRILIPSILTHFNRALYIDTDIVVRHDLQELFGWNLGDNLLAGVPAAWTVKKRNRAKWMNAGKFQSLDEYVNAGVLLLNLKLMRELDIEKKCLELMTKNVRLLKLDGDQSVLNFVCQGKISFLPFRCNVTASNLKHRKSLPIFFSEGEVQSALCDPLIFHWTGPLKPWKYYDVPLAHEWWKFYRRSPFGDIPLNRMSTSDLCGKIFKALKEIF